MSRARDWWTAQGYKKDHPVHKGTDFYVKGNAPEGQVLEERADDNRGSANIPLTENPTKTSNPSRPRTLAAGYDYDQDVLRVVFREGAVYDYFGVPTSVAYRFRKSASPGRFINRVLNAYEYSRIE